MACALSAHSSPHRVPPRTQRPCGDEGLCAAVPSASMVATRCSACCRTAPLRTALQEAAWMRSLIRGMQHDEGYQAAKVQIAKDLGLRAEEVRHQSVPWYRDVGGT